MGKIRKLLIVGMIAILLVGSLYGCSSKQTKVDDVNISDGVYNWFLVKAYDAACAKNGGKEGIWDIKIGGTPVKDWIVSEAKTYTAQYVTINEKFKEYGLVLSESDKSEIKDTVENYWNASGYNRYYEPYNINEEDFTNIMTYEYETDMLKNKIKSDLTKKISEEDIKNYIKDNGDLVTYIAIPTSIQSSINDSDVETASKLIDYDATYKEVLKQASDGEKLKELAKNAQENEDWIFSGVTTSYADGVAEALILDDNTHFTDGFHNELSNSKVGTVKSYNDDTNYYRIIFMKEDFNENWKGYDSYKETVENKLVDLRFNDELAGWAKDKKVTLSGKSKNIDLKEFFTIVLK